MLRDPSDGTHPRSFSRSAVEVALRPPFFSAPSARFLATRFLGTFSETSVTRAPLQTRLISIVEPVLEAAGYELVDLRFTLEQGLAETIRWYRAFLRVATPDRLRRERRYHRCDYPRSYVPLVTNA